MNAKHQTPPHPSSSRLSPKVEHMPSKCSKLFKYVCSPCVKLLDSIGRTNALMLIIIFTMADVLFFRDNERLFYTGLKPAILFVIIHYASPDFPRTFNFFAVVCDIGQKVFAIIFGGMLLINALPVYKENPLFQCESTIANTLVLVDLEFNVIVDAWDCIFGYKKRNFDAMLSGTYSPKPWFNWLQCFLTIVSWIAVMLNVNISLCVVFALAILFKPKFTELLKGVFTPSKKEWAIVYYGAPLLGFIALVAWSITWNHIKSSLKDTENLMPGGKSFFAQLLVFGMIISALDVYFKYVISTQDRAFKDHKFKSSDIEAVLVAIAVAFHIASTHAFIIRTAILDFKGDVEAEPVTPDPPKRTLAPRPREE